MIRIALKYQKFNRIIFYEHRQIDVLHLPAIQLPVEHCQSESQATKNQDKIFTVIAKTTIHFKLLIS